MPRIARVVATGLPHHVTQRGNRRAVVFFDDDDRRFYLRFLQHYRKKHRLDILAYCLMPNHIHLVVIPENPSSLARTLAETHMRYAKYINWKLNQNGHLWQGRFYSCVLDEPHTLAAARYVEMNPVRAGLVASAWEYSWSSASAHVGIGIDNLLSKRWPSRQLLAKWREMLYDVNDDPKIEAMRSSTRTGRPLGSEAFVEMVERMIGRIVRPKKAGRPRNMKHLKVL
jgi:putative transposase